MPNLSRCFPIRVKTFNCLAAFLQILVLWLLKFNLKSMVTPKSLTSSSQTMEIPSKFNIIFLSWVFWPREIAWYFSGFACISLTENKLTMLYYPLLRKLLLFLKICLILTRCCHLHNYIIHVCVQRKTDYWQKY